MLFNKLAKLSTLQVRLMASKTGTSTVVKGAGVAFGVCGVGGLAYSLKNAMMPAQDNNLARSTVWPQYVKDRVRGTFGYCLGGIGFTVAGAMATLRSPAAMRFVGSNSMMSFIGCIALMMGSGMICRSVPFDGNVLGMKSALYYLHMGIVGAVIAPIAAVGGSVCVQAAGLTAAVMAGLAFTGMVAPSDAYMKTYAFVNAGCFAMLGACVASFFVNPASVAGAGLSSFIVLGGLVLFSVKGFSDMQRCVAAAQQPGQFDPVNHSLAITMDAINIFIRLAMMMGGNRRK